MGLFGPFEYKSKKTGVKFYLHEKDVGKVRLYYFSKDPVGAMGGMPGGFEVVENQMQGVPFLKKIAGAADKQKAAPAAKDAGQK
jgi:hypothetical protein